MNFLFLTIAYRSIIWVTYSWILKDKRRMPYRVLLHFTFYILAQAMEGQKLEQLNHATFCEAIRLKLERVMRTKQHCLGTK